MRAELGQHGTDAVDGVAYAGRDGLARPLAGARPQSGAGFRDVGARTVVAPLRLPSSRECVRFERESFGALHQMLAGLAEEERDAVWAEIEAALGEFETDAGFEAPCELLVAAGTR